MHPPGIPDAMPLAMVTTSGTMPKFWKPNGFPVRNMPHCTSSHIMSASLSLQSLRTSRRKSALHTCTPDSPWMHSSITAHMESPMVSNSARSESTSFMGVGRKPSGMGSKPEWKAACPVAASVASVRPWKLFTSVTTTDGARSGFCPFEEAWRFARRRASFMAHSLASAPELAKNAFHVLGATPADPLPTFNSSESRSARRPLPSM